MNIQIFGTKKSFDTKKAQRYFKERRIKVQFIDLKEKEMSKGELTSVMQAVGGIDKLLNPKAKDEETLALIQHLTPSQRFDKLLENQQVLDILCWIYFQLLIPICLLKRSWKLL